MGDFRKPPGLARNTCGAEAWGQAALTGLVHLLSEDVGSGECTLPSLDSHCDISCQFCLCLGKFLVCSVLRGNKFLIFYYKSEFNSSWVVFLCGCCFWYCIAQCTLEQDLQPYSHSLPPALACLFNFPACNSTQRASMSFWKHRKVVSCIRVKSLCSFGVHRSTLTSQWLKCLLVSLVSLSKLHTL